MYYEIGLAHAFRVTAVLITDDVSSVEFDLQHERVLRTQGDDGVPRTESLKIELKEALASALTATPTTAVEVAYLKEEAAAAQHPADNNGANRASPDRQDEVWRDLAMTGVLRRFGRADLVSSGQVYHLTYGFGALIGHSPVDGDVISGTVTVRSGRIMLPLPDDRLYSAEILPK